MPSNRDDVVSGYVRAKIREWRDSGRELQDLARVAGFAKSTPSQVLQGTGIGAKTGPRFATAFGFRTYDDLKIAAFDWWKGQASNPPSARPAELLEAIEAVVGLGQGSIAQVETILGAYAHERFKGRDRDWWIQTLLAELARDRQDIRADKAQRTEAAAGQKVILQANRGRRAPKAAKSSPRRQRAG